MLVRHATLLPVPGWRRIAHQVIVLRPWVRRQGRLPHKRVPLCDNRLVLALCVRIGKWNAELGRCAAPWMVPAEPVPGQ